MTLLTGEHLALDLVNTRATTAGGDVDQLDSPAGLAAWLEAEGTRLDGLPSEFSDSDVAAVRTLRGHIQSAVDAARRGQSPPVAAVTAINHAAEAAPAVARLAVDGSQPVAVTRRLAAPLAQLLAQLAEAAIDLLTSPRVRDIRTCDGPACRMIFIPAHPRRRWCSPELCGNRTRVARYYQRHKATGSPPR